MQLNKSGSYLDHLMSQLPDIIKFVKQLQKGKTWTMLKVIIYFIPDISSCVCKHTRLISDHEYSRRAVHE